MSKKRWIESEIEEVRARYRAGETDEEIALRLGRSAASVSNIRQFHNITRPRTSLRRSAEWSQSELDIASQMYAEGWPNEDIAKSVGRTKIAIKRLITDRSLQRDPAAAVDPSRFDTDLEQWKRYRNHRYAVSSLGRVMSLTPGRLGLIVFPWIDKDGYCHATLQISGKPRRFSIHRMVAETFFGPPPTESHQAAHNNGIPMDNRAINLRWATPKENQADRIIHGTACRDKDGKLAQCRRSRADMITAAQEAGVPVYRPRPSGQI